MYNSSIFLRYPAIVRARLRTRKTAFRSERSTGLGALLGDEQFTPSPALAASRTIARPVNPMAHYPNDDAGYARCYESTKRPMNAGNVNKDDCNHPSNQPGQHTPL
jgi:hypothetical protein